MSIRRATLLLLISVLAFRVAPALAADPTPAASPGAAPAAEDFTTTKSGLKYFDIKVGTGATPAPGKSAVIGYSMAIDNGNIIERATALKPFVFVIGKDQALKAMEEGVSTMKVGGQRKLIVAPELAYGAAGGGKVPPNATLTIEMELLEVR
jgi:peptidylprolyl isomerase